MAGLEHAVSSCNTIERECGKQFAVERAFGLLEGVASYLAVTVGPRQAYDAVQRAADTIATGMLDKA